MNYYEKIGVMSKPARAAYSNRPSTITPQRKQRTDKIPLEKSVELFMVAHSRWEYGDKNKSEPKFIYKLSKKRLWALYCKFHEVHKEWDANGRVERTWVKFNVNGNEGNLVKKPVLSLETFRKAFPKERFVQDKWHKCVCQDCAKANYVLEDVLDVHIAAHSGNPVLSSVKGDSDRTACNDESCPWTIMRMRGELPKATSRMQDSTLLKDNDHNIPFLLCRECKCFSASAAPPGLVAGQCSMRNKTGPCSDCGTSKFPMCRTLADANPRCRSRKWVSYSSMPNARARKAEDTHLPFNELMAHFKEVFDKWLPHGLGDLHTKRAKELFLARCREDPTRAMFFADWSDKLVLIPDQCGTGTDYPKLALIIGILVFLRDGKLVAKTVTGITDAGDNSVFPTWLFFRRVLQQLKTENPRVKKVTFMTDGGQKHFRNTTSFFLFPHLQRLTSLELEWAFFKEYHGKYVYDAEGGVAKCKLLTALFNGLHLTNAESAVSLLNGTYGAEWRSPSQAAVHEANFNIASRTAILITARDIKLLANVVKRFDFSQRYEAFGKPVEKISKRTGSSLRPYHMRPLLPALLAKLCHSAACVGACSCPDEHCLPRFWRHGERAGDPESVLPTFERLRGVSVIQWRHLPLECSELHRGTNFVSAVKSEKLAKVSANAAVRPFDSLNAD